MNKLVYAALVGSISAAKWTADGTSNSWEITYDNELKGLKFVADVSSGQSLWLLFSQDCSSTSCDQLAFSSEGAGSIKDNYGTSSAPRPDFINAYKVPKITRNDNGSMFHFEAMREREPNDVVGKDVKFPCDGTTRTFTYLMKDGGQTGSWDFKLNEDCSVYEQPQEET